MGRFLPGSAFLYMCKLKKKLDDLEQKYQANTYKLTLNVVVVLIPVAGDYCTDLKELSKFSKEKCLVFVPCCSYRKVIGHNPVGKLNNSPF